MKNGGYLMTSQKQQLNEQKMINHLSTVGILGNVILTAFKLLAGIIGHSGAMISDAVHSLSDVFATFIAFLGVKLSKKSADSEHPYGHDRLECVASMVLAAILLATGIGIGMSGVITVICRHRERSHLWQLSCRFLQKRGCSGIPDIMRRFWIPQHSWQMHGITDQMHFLPLVH